MHWALPPAETSMSREPLSSSSSPKSPLSSSSRFVSGLDRLTFTSSFTLRLHFFVACIVDLQSIICCCNYLLLYYIAVLLLLLCCCCCRVYERKSMSTERYTVAFCDILLVQCVNIRLWVGNRLLLCTITYCFMCCVVLFLF